MFNFFGKPKTPIEALSTVGGDTLPRNSGQGVPDQSSEDESFDLISKVIEDLSPAQQFQKDVEKRLLDELFVATSQYRGAEGYAELLKFVAGFKRYSAYNAMLVHVQKRGARYVLTASKWKKEYDHVVKPGAQPLLILQPGGPVMFVFDVSDVEPGDPKCNSLPEKITNPFAVHGADVSKVGHLFQNLKCNCKRDGIRVRTVAHGVSNAGSIQPAEPTKQIEYQTKTFAVPRSYEMLLNSSHSEATQFATAVHELAHLYCGHLGTLDSRWWPDRRGASIEVREFEAESVCYLVCKRHGLDPGSDKYLSGYLDKDKQIPEISVDTVMKVTRQIELLVAKSYTPRKQHRIAK